MRPDPGARRVLVGVALAAFAALLLWSGLTTLLLAAADQGLALALSAMAGQALPSLLLLGLAAFVAALALAAAWMPWWRRHVAAQSRLLEQAQSLLHADGSPRLEGPASPALQGLAETLNQLMQQRRAARDDIAAQVQQGSQQLADERARLAALMAELNQSVVVCNLDGRILLYNNRARLQFRALSQVPAVAGGAELIGLGRSIYPVIDRDHLAHALVNIQNRLQRGAANPSTEFVISTRNGQLLQVHMAPVRQTAAPQGHHAAARAPVVDAGDAGDAGQASRPAKAAASDAPVRAALAEGLSGFVLMLTNITREHARELAQASLIAELSEGHRGSLGKLQAAVELLDDPALDGGTRERLQAVVRDETRQMSERLKQLLLREGGNQAAVRTRWPLHEMAGTDLLAAATRRIETACGARLLAAETDPAIWLRVDSFALLQALQWLATHVVEGLGARSLRLRLAPHRPAASSPPGDAPQPPSDKPDHSRVQLDLVWAGAGISTETALAWETETMVLTSTAGGAEAPMPLAAGLSVREVLNRHHGSCWFERDRVRHESFFRLLLPRADQDQAAETGAESSPDTGAASSAALLHDSRPEYYDFDLFGASESHTELDERLLSDLNYTVFDTETTGLNPVGGDQIIQVGAVRVVRGRVLRQEHFDQLVDPGRPIPAAGIPIHGITDEMVRGQPDIAAVLPAFHTFVGDTVLVAHNAAFDMRFLQLQEDRTGLRFDQPVLDTLLMSAALHPQQSSHRLEAIADRLGVNVMGRHHALGDALVTADVLVKLLPLLAAKGIRTLGQARAAAQQTWYARLKY